MQDNSNTNTSENGGVKASMNFMKAIENNEVEELNNVLENETISKVTLGAGLIKALINYRNNSDSIDIIDSLLNHNADPNLLFHHKSPNSQITTAEKVTILMYACHKGDLQLIHTIIKHNPNVNLKDANNRNALFYAINADKGDNADIVMTLINSGINVNEPEKESKESGTSNSVAGHSPLTLATQKNMRNTVKTLLDHGADPDWTVNRDGNTALHYAVKNTNIVIIEKLLSKNANLRAINKDNFTPLSLALKLSHTDIYKSLCEEHNKIVKRENEMADNLITEHANSNVGASTSANQNKSNQKSNKKKNRELEFSSDKGATNTQKVLEYENVKDEVVKEEVPPGDIKQTEKEKVITKEEKSSAPKKRNPKLELISRIKQLKLNDMKSKSSHSSQSNETSNKTTSSTCGLEIPFEINRKIGDSNLNQFQSYIKIRGTPTLFLDLSSKSKEDNAILSSQVDEMTNILNEKAMEIKMLQDNLKYLTEENFKLSQDNHNLTEILAGKEKYINSIHNEWVVKEEQLLNKIKDLQSQLEFSSNSQNDLSKRCEKFEKDILELNNKNNMIVECKQLHKEQSFNRKDYLDKKFINCKYEDKYIIKCLQKDIIDFQEYTKEQIKKNKAVVDELLKFVQNAVNECIPDYEVKLYGSHATGLCLNWSDLDIVLVSKRTQYSSNYAALQGLFLNLYDKPWKKSIKLIETAVIPIIKITSSDEYNSMQMDISLQDGKHYGLKCVELVRTFMSEYEALEPLIFALKNLLKNANLNDPYTGGLSSYGLILMVVSYLQSQLESNKPIKIADGNIGRLFLEFLCYYGLIFDHTKYVIYTYAPADLNFVDKDGSNFFFNMQSGHELIIVDPLNKANNVARSSYQFVNIKMAFMIGFVVSREECECGCHFNKITEDSQILNNDHCILKRIFNSVKRFNANGNSQ